MEEGRYSTVLWFTGGNSMTSWGLIANITRRRLLKRLRRHGITKGSLDRQYKTETGYWIDGFIHRNLALEIRGPHY